MNSIGRIFRVSIFGESHQAAVGVLIDGCPPGIEIRESDFKADLERRQSGARGTTPRKEEDEVQVLSGLFNDHATGAPILLVIPNQNLQSDDYTGSKDIPRPGQADFTAFHKYNGYHDFRGGGHFSGRLTAGLVAAGVIAKKILSFLTVTAELVEAGGSGDISAAVDRAVKNQDSIGGLIHCRVENLPVGWGEPFFDSMESVISHLIFSIPGVKGIEFGSGFKASSMTGSQFNDEILDRTGRTASNHAGGINGGISNGNNLEFSVALRPAASIPGRQWSVNLNSGERTELSIKGRHDLCFALRVPVIIEAAAALALTDLYLLQEGSVSRPGE